MTSLLAHSVWLTLVLRHALVHLADNVGSDGRFEDIRQRDRVRAGASIWRDHRDCRTARHIVGCGVRFVGNHLR